MPLEEREVLRADRPLEELRTVLVLEEAFGPRGYRELRNALGDEAARGLLDDLARLAVSQMHEIDDLLGLWRRAEPVPASKTDPPAVGLSGRERIEGLVELKSSEAEVLRHVANAAPTPEIRARLERLAREQDEAAERLRSILK